MSTANILSTIIAVVSGIGALVCWIISIFVYKEIKNKISGTKQEVVLSMKAGTCVLEIGLLLIILVQVLAGAG